MRRILITFVLLTLAGVALAGVEPSPFKTEINKLGAVDNVLVSSQANLDMAIASDPNDNGLAGRVEAIGSRLLVADGKVAAVLEPLHPPEPGMPLASDLHTALLVVQTDALGLVASADAVLHPPEPGLPPDDLRVFDAYVQVASAGQRMVARIEAFLFTGDACDGVCYDEYAACLATGAPQASCDDDFSACSDTCDIVACESGCRDGYSACLALGTPEATCNANFSSCMTSCGGGTCDEGCFADLDACILEGTPEAQCNADFDVCTYDCGVNECLDVCSDAHADCLATGAPPVECGNALEVCSAQCLFGGG